MAHEFRSLPACVSLPLRTALLVSLYERRAEFEPMTFQMCRAVPNVPRRVKFYGVLGLHALDRWLRVPRVSKWVAQNQRV